MTHSGTDALGLPALHHGPGSYPLMYVGFEYGDTAGIASLENGVHCHDGLAGQCVQMYCIWVLPACSRRTEQSSVPGDLTWHGAPCCEMRPQTVI